MGNTGDCVTDLVEEILRWENLAPTLHSEALKLVVAEHTETLREQLLQLTLNPMLAPVRTLTR